MTPMVVGFACKVELLTTSSMDLWRLPLWHLSRQKHMDNRLWKREEKKAMLYGLISLHCPCNKCKGQFVYALHTIKIQLLLNGRDPFHRIWRGPCDRNS